MTKLLIKLFVKNYQNTDDIDVRNNYGIFSGTVGIITNILLFTGKIIAGLLASSIGIVADAFNNLSDAGSSIVSLVGFKMASKPADNEHPFGHGRFEYISGFIISMVIIFMSFEVGKSSIEKIIHPQKLVFSGLTIIILIVSVLIKIWLGLFYNGIGKKISSSTLKVAAKDSFNDVLSTSAVIIGIVFAMITRINIDGYLGLVVAVFILITGISTARSMIDYILGEAPDKQFVHDIKQFVLSYEEIVGVHDVMVHNYGAKQYVVSLHAEVPCDADIIKIHDVIDIIELELKDKFHCQAVIHMDPIVTNDEYTLNIKNQIIQIIKEIDTTISLHDFRLVVGNTHTNLIFDIVIPFEFKYSDAQIVGIITEKIKEFNSSFYSVITIDKEPS